ncbi:PQQ-dependent sugar dehydrogenase [Alkalilacustris brevis]|uniref:PQQ-dependent sugar dehydrogenase n=1 Tax=Alkalilacustris brevis TaxID=2026338 RepID=UPI001EE4C964|nr:PQQ-dependent sugar dehydrogenase [Alkalilacustris brevis]
MLTPTPRKTRMTATVALAAVALGAMALSPAEAEIHEVEILAEGLEHPWGMTFLPGSGGDILLTERPGAVKLWEAETGTLHEISGAPAVDARRQGGLLDIAVAPDFAQSGLVYMTWAGRVDSSATTTHLGRSRLDRETGALRDLEVLFQVGPAMDSQAHYGSRIVFHDGHLFMGTGDRGQKDFGPGHIAQDLGSENGAVLRLTLDGGIPEDNPFVDQEGAAPAIWSYGHRNIQAMAVHPDSGDIWLAEHGEAGGDEVNLVQRGGNYGWPLAAFGVDYRTGEPFADPHREGDGFIAPAYHWEPGREDHFPPSGMAFYEGDAFPDWQGQMLIGNLFHQYLGLFAVEGDQVAPPERLLEGQGWRIRDVAVGPDDGFVYIIVDDEDAPLLRLVPAG